MDKRYYLMRKNEVITLLQFSDEGKLIAYSKNIPGSAGEIAPLSYRCMPDKWLYKWWEDRSIPLSRDQIREFLSERGLSNPEQYLIKNLGLSLTDYYWIKPVDSDLTWERVNLFDNPFHDDVFLSSRKPESDGTVQCTPNSSLQGDKEKAWTISDGKRRLVKGNHTNTSSESLNEVIASRLHALQDYDNHTDYQLIHIAGKPYAYGCICDAFTSQELELVSAWSVVTSEPMDKNTSYYEHFINVCRKHGMDEDQLRGDLEYLIMSDYVLTGYDRHLNNIAVLRDADTLRFVRIAPIYDSGDCLFARRPVPKNTKELQKMEITSFAKTEVKQLKLVQNRSLLDVNRLPSADYIRDMYHKDDKMSDRYIESILEWYERKIAMLDRWQHGSGKAT